MFDFEGFINSTPRALYTQKLFTTISPWIEEEYFDG